MGDRNVYSLVLIDDIVNAVDKIAYERNTSRSNLINQILAEYLSFPTPEMRIKRIFGSMEQMISDMDSFQLQFQQSDTMISLRSALQYRYRPSIRYVLELYRSSGPAFGELRVSLRTQSRPLMQILDGFFSFWVSMENRAVGRLFPERQVYCRVEPGRYIRQFLLPGEESERTDEAIARAVSDYIRLFDRSLKYYFARPGAPEEAEAEIEAHYRGQMQNGTVI